MTADRSPEPMKEPETNFPALWTAEFIRDIDTKRARVVGSLASLKSPDSSYRRGHERMLRLYDAALSAVRAEALRLHRKNR